MREFQRAEFIILMIMLFVNLGFVIFFLGFGGLSGFAVSENKKSIFPSDFVTEDKISVEHGKILIDFPDAVLSRYEDSESMLPVLGKGSTGVGFKPTSAEQIKIGDIISFKQNDKVIVHRVIEKGSDETGVYFITQGDNNNVADEKIRFENIDSVLVAVIY